MATILDINYATAVNGTAYNVDFYERTPHGVDAADPLNPYVVSSEMVQVSGGRLTLRGGDPNDWNITAACFGSFGPETGGWWDATQACLTCIYTFKEDALGGGGGSFCPLLVVAKSELPPGPYPFRLALDDDGAGNWILDLLAQGWDANITDTSQTFTLAQLDEQTVTVRVEWQCGTVASGFSDVAHDGFVRVYWNGVLVINKINVDLFISDDQGDDNWANGVYLGFSGLPGEVHRLTVNDTLCSASSSERNLLTGQGHSVTGSDNVIAGRQGTMIGDVNVLLNLDGTARTRTKNGYFGVFADEIEFGGGGSFTIPDESVTYAKMQNVSAASRLLGRGDSGAGDVQEITLGAGLAMSGTTLAASGAGTLTFVRKTSDESVTSSITLQADNELLFAVGASETWDFDFNVHYLGNTTGDFRCGLKFPTSPTQVQYGIRGPAATATGDPDFVGDQNVRGGFTADAVAGMPLGATTVQSWAQLKGFIRNGSNAGNVVLWWAQGTSDGTATTVKAGSWVIARQIA